MLTHPEEMERNNNEGKNSAYMIILLLGLACVLPWTAVTTAADYFNSIYEGMAIEFWFPVSNFAPLLIGLGLMTLFGQKLNMKWRVRCAMAGLTISIFLLLVVNILVSQHQLDKTVGFSWALVLLAASSIACAVLQASLFGISGILGDRYIQALQFGMGWCEIFVSVLRVITKSNCSTTVSGTVFFSVTTLILIASFGLVLKLEKLSLTQSVFALHPPTFSLDKGVVCTEYGIPSYGSVVPVGANPVVNGTPKSQRPHTSSDSLTIFLKAWEPLVVIFAVFVICLSFFPGVITSFQARHWNVGSWFPVILVSVYCVGDILGKGLPVFINIFQVHNKPILWGTFFLHLGFCPLFIAGIIGPEDSVLGSELYYCSIIFLLGFSTGYIGCASAMLVTKLVDKDEVECAGMMCPFFTISGLLGGSFVGVYCFSNMMKNSHS